tara:strand:- start:287 stop:541 length:255 start_codon:yes stop_codon:yes gene_type:complete
MIWVRKRQNYHDVFSSIPKAEVDTILDEVQGAKEIPFIRLSKSHIFINAISVPDTTEKTDYKFDVEEYREDDLRPLTSRDLNPI